MKWRSWPLPRIRRTAQTVRGPVARMAPTARAWALVQTPWENSGAKAARMTTISGGRSTGFVSEVEGSCITVDHRPRPLGLPVNFEWNRVRQLSALDKVEWRPRVLGSRWLHGSVGCYPFR